MSEVRDRMSEIEHRISVLCFLGFTVSYRNEAKKISKILTVHVKHHNILIQYMYIF
jgi:hypothetical protein